MLLDQVRGHPNGRRMLDALAFVLLELNFARQ